MTEKPYKKGSFSYFDNIEEYFWTFIKSKMGTIQDMFKGRFKAFGRHIHKGPRNILVSNVLQNNKF